MSATENIICRYPRILVAAGASGSGKTMITCGLLQALKNRGLDVTSFKCGPDYIDPMFHARVIKTQAGNLDTFFTDEATTRYLFAQNAAAADISVIEGVMGYYDGLGGVSEKASAYDVARVTQTPTVLLVDTKGMSLSALAYIKGYMQYREDSNIRGVILNRFPAGMYEEMKLRIEEELDVRVYGYVPKIPELVLESRHLGLVLPEEVHQLEEKLQRLAGVLEETLDIDGLIALANSAGELPCGEPQMLAEILHGDRAEMLRRKKPVIAVARDEAFCFIYENNLRLLRDLGAQIIEFSPLYDREIPKEADGLLLFGGYPELYAKRLSENTEMLRDLREKIEGGIPCLAECGGFMYLHRTMEDTQKHVWPMAGVIDAETFYTGKLCRFGYIKLTADGQSDEIVRGHEFHYFDSTDNGDTYVARKPLRKRHWKCIHRKYEMLAGFPHLYYYSNPQFAVEFCERCAGYAEKKK